MTTSLALLEASGYAVEADHTDYTRRVLFVGTGWYSQADNGIYYYGKSATYSRIYIGEAA